MASFESVADEYDAGRPDHPPGVYDALGSLAGRQVLDVGAGTGIATRALLARGAAVVAVDPGEEVLARARRRTPGLPAVVADGARLPVGDQQVELLCFAQSWHWLDPSTRVVEAHRVLRPGGRWAGWWSHARADGQPWFDQVWSAIEAACPGTRRDQRDTDWGATISDPARFTAVERVVVPWVRTLSVGDWLTDQASHSYVAVLPASVRQDLLDRLRAIVSPAAPEQLLRIPYETWLWLASRR